MAFDNCDSEFCDVKIEQGALMIAPCGTIIDPEPVDGVVGKPDFVSIFPDFEFEDATDIDINFGREFNQKKTLRCRTRCSDTTDPVLTFSVCVCFKDTGENTSSSVQFHAALADPTASCTFDWLYFPCPADCDNPNPETDAFWYGTSKGGFDNYGGAASDTESLTLSVTTASCGRRIDRCNFPDQDVVAPLVSSKATGLVANKKAA